MTTELNFDITNIDDCLLVNLPRIIDHRGSLSFLEDGVIPFEPRRLFYIYDIPTKQKRGAHAHKCLHQFIIALSGAFTVVCNDGKIEKEFCLDTPWEGLYIPPGIWANEQNYSSGAIAIVAASDKYDESDYIRDMKTFVQKKFINTNNGFNNL